MAERIQGRIDLILHASRGTEENMTLDREALARAEDGGATLRLYTWNEPCVSIGKSQRLEDVEDLHPGLPIVRRSTGGGAVRHGEDQTLAFAVPLAMLGVGPRALRETYRLLVGPIAGALSSVRLRCRLAEDRATAPNRDCFASVGALDLIDDRGVKVAGCALAATRTAALLHASIPGGTDAPVFGLHDRRPKGRETSAWDCLHFPHALAAVLRWNGWDVHLRELDPNLPSKVRALAVLHQILDPEGVNAIPNHEFEEEYDGDAEAFASEGIEDLLRVRLGDLPPHLRRELAERLRGFADNPYPDLLREEGGRPELRRAT